MYEIGEKTETIPSSLQACFVITHSSGNFIVKNIHNHGMAGNFNALFNCYTVIVCFCGGMRTRVHYIY